MIKKYEAYGEPLYDWRKEFLQIRELFYNIEENVWDYEGSLDFQAGVRTSMNSHQYPCYLKNDEIVGDTDMIDKTCGNWANFCARITINPNFKNSNYSPFKTNGNQSFFGENANKMLDIMMRINYIKGRMKDYSIGVTFDRSEIYVNFLRNK